MRFTFKFLLANGTTEQHTFAACDYKTALNAAFIYAKTAFLPNELVEFYYLP